MPAISNSATFTFGAAALVAETVDIEVLALPFPSTDTGTGRLVHPTLGTLDYDYAPTLWTNIDGDVLFSPVWATTKTLRGAASTLWRGDLRDVQCVERWEQWAGDLKMRMEMLRTLWAFYANPPEPPDAWIEWHPTYTTELAFRVALTSLTVGGEGVNLDPTTKQGWARGDVELRLQVLGRIED